MRKVKVLNALNGSAPLRSLPQLSIFATAIVTAFSAPSAFAQSALGSGRVYSATVTEYFNRDIYRSGMARQSKSIDGEGRVYSVEDTQYVLLSAEPSQVGEGYQRFLNDSNQLALEKPYQRPVMAGQGALPLSSQAWHVAAIVTESVTTEGGAAADGLPPGPGYAAALAQLKAPANISGLRSRKQYAYDRTGNVIGYCDSGVLDVATANLPATAPFVAGSPAASDRLLDDDVCARIDYSRVLADVRPEVNLTGLPTRIQVYGGPGANAVLQVSADGTAGTPTAAPGPNMAAPSLLRQRRAEYVPEKGLLIAVHQDRLVDGLSETSRLNYAADGQLLSFTPPNGDVLQFEWEPTTRGLITKVTDSFGEYSETRYTDQTLAWGLASQEYDLNGAEIRYQYDAFGRLSGVWGPYDLASVRPTIAFEYHPEGLYPNGSPNGILPWAGSRKLDIECPVLPNNAYDPAACLNSYRTSTMDRVVYTDGIGRERQVQEDARVNGQVGRRISGGQDWDSLGRVVASFAPTFDPGRTWPAAAAGDTRVSGFTPARSAIPPTKSQYDVLDRPRVVTEPDNTIWRTDYGLVPDPDGLLTRKTTSTDPLGATTHKYEDGSGQITAVTAVDRDSRQESKLHYRYDPLGQITDVLETGGGHTRAEYDALGRLTLLENPDTGRVRKVYGPTGQLAQLIRPDQREVNYQYDKSRLVAVIPTAPPVFSVAGQPVTPMYSSTQIGYSYGRRGDGANGAGRIVTTQHQAGMDSRKFGLLGEAIEETHRLDRPHPIIPPTPLKPNPRRIDTFTFANVYDSWGRLRKRLYPEERSANPTGLVTAATPPAARELLTFGYDLGGEATSVVGLLPYQTDTWYNEWGAKTAAFYGNAGANTEGGVQERWTYDPLRQRLAQKQTLLPNIAKVQDAAPGGAVLGPPTKANTLVPGFSTTGRWLAQDVSYHYDAVGRMSGLADSAAPYPDHPLTAMLSQTFDYDDFGRLTAANGLRITRNAVGLEQNDSFSAEYGYDALHNLTRQIVTHNPLPGRASKGRAYAYHYGSQRPHAVTRVNDQILEYDNNGQRTGWGRISGQTATAPVPTAAPSLPAMGNTGSSLTPQAFQRSAVGGAAAQAPAQSTTPNTAAPNSLEGALRALGGQTPATTPPPAGAPPASVTDDPRTKRPSP